MNSPSSRHQLINCPSTVREAVEVTFPPNSFTSAVCQHFGIQDVSIAQNAHYILMNLDQFINFFKFNYLSVFWMHLLAFTDIYQLYILSVSPFIESVSPQLYASTFYQSISLHQSTIYPSSHSHIISSQLSPTLHHLPNQFDCILVHQPFINPPTLPAIHQLTIGPSTYHQSTNFPSIQQLSIKSSILPVSIKCFCVC